MIPAVGTLSDRVEFRPIAKTSGCSAARSPTFIFARADSLGVNESLSRIIGGIGGVWRIPVRAYIADVTTPGAEGRQNGLYDWTGSKKRRW